MHSVSFLVLTVKLIFSLYGSIFCVIFAERQFCDMKLDELNELEDEIDEEDERIFEAYRLYCINCQNNTNILT